MTSLSLAVSATVASVALAALFVVPNLPCHRAGNCGGAALEETQADWKLVADCVEVRSASVFAGPCHYNGEVVTQGGEALLAIRVERGTSKGVDLAGVRAAALVQSDKNLKLDGARRSLVYVGEGASPEQSAAIVELLRERSHDGLGEIVQVESAALTIASDGEGFHVRVPGRVELAGKPMPDRDCCKMPNLVWYEPLVPLKARVVGFTDTWRVDEPRLGLQFERVEENSAFVGRLSFFEGGCAAGETALQ